jgi:glycosyltransferase involved in cell wall biosynthesis
MTTPLLILSDSILGSTGLGRVTRELAIRIHKDLSDVFRVGVVGVGGTTSRWIPFANYPTQMAGDHRIPALPAIWNDFCGAEPGILMPIQNAAWLRWLAFPEQDLKEIVKAGKMKRWCYVPVDSESVGGRLPKEEVEILEQMDRVLAYTKFGSMVIDRSMEGTKAWKNPSHFGACPNLPHGTDTRVFYPRDRVEARRTFGKRILNVDAPLSDKTLMLGVVATNSARKEWPLVFQTAAELKARGEKVGIWAHTDRMQGYWNLETMAKAFGLETRTQFSTRPMSDDEMAWGYSACDVFLGIAPEGWGLPMTEAMACGTPIVSGGYAGAMEFLPENSKVVPHAWRYDGFYCNLRPLYQPADFADRVLHFKGSHQGLSLLAPHHTWDGCWLEWQKWLKEGVA